MTLLAQFDTKTSWLNPELLTVPWETMDQWIKNTPGLKPYRHNLEDLFRQQTHVLTEDKEMLLSYFSELGNAPDEIYTELSTSDITFPTIVLSNGDSVEVTRGNYSKVMRTNYNQEDRKVTFTNHYEVFAKDQNTYAAMLRGVCQKDWAYAQARNYGSTLEAALDDDNVPLSVYENLVQTVRENTAPLKKYAELRKRVLGIEDYHLYDGAVPLVQVDKTYPYEDAKKWSIASVAPLGKAYQEKYKKAIQGGWIDVYETPGKRSGAYSANVYGVHPYMLLNYNETLDYVFTLAHEMGHTMHTTLSNENQPYATHDYTIFVAEVASTLNERLLLEYLLSQWKDPKDRILLLTQAIDNIEGTFFAQVMFADFEWRVHQLVENGEPVTASKLNEMMFSIYEDYYGGPVNLDKLYEVLWARISHFFSVPYYVYQYSTCYASSAQIYDKLTKGSEADKKAALDKYMTLLKSGGNDYPMEQLKKAGVDLSQPEPVQAVISQMNELVDRLEKEISKL